MRKLKIGAKEASDLMAEGYTVECYLILPDPIPTKTQRKMLAPRIPKDAQLAYSPEGEVPHKGRVAAAWKYLLDKTFRDPRSKYTRGNLEKMLRDQKFTDPVNLVSQLIHKYHILRVAE